LNVFSPIHDFAASAIFQSLGVQSQILQIDFISGGCISTAAKIVSSEGIFFLKWNESESELFKAEAAGLEMLSESGTVKAPRVYGQGKVAEKYFILMEFISSSQTKEKAQALLAEELAELHRQTWTHFGLAQNNFIGSLAQNNESKTSWSGFFIENRLEVQAGLAYYNRLVDAEWLNRFQKIYPKLASFFPDGEPSLLHGDLWSGNIVVGPQGYYWLIDPAIYFGHREMELAFTTLFGGFEKSFYDAYHQNFPLAAGFKERIDVYNLYPLLVHANLFGASYLKGVNRIIQKFI
jgi:protein-ribulosamine 3-kinase